MRSDPSHVHESRETERGRDREKEKLNWFTDLRVLLFVAWILFHIRSATRHSVYPRNFSFAFNHSLHMMMKLNGRRVAHMLNGASGARTCGHMHSRVKIDRLEFAECGPHWTVFFLFLLICCHSYSFSLSPLLSLTLLFNFRLAFLCVPNRKMHFPFVLCCCSIEINSINSVYNRI